MDEEKCVTVDMRVKFKVNGSTTKASNYANIAIGEINRCVNGSSVIRKPNVEIMSTIRERKDERKKEVK
jgi:hypothetical protein